MSAVGKSRDCGRCEEESREVFPRKEEDQTSHLVHASLPDETSKPRRTLRIARATRGAKRDAKKLPRRQGLADFHRKYAFAKFWERIEETQEVKPNGRQNKGPWGLGLGENWPRPDVTSKKAGKLELANLRRMRLRTGRITRNRGTTKGLDPQQHEGNLNGRVGKHQTAGLTRKMDSVYRGSSGEMAGTAYSSGVNENSHDQTAGSSQRVLRVSRRPESGPCCSCAACILSGTRLPIELSKKRIAVSLDIHGQLGLNDLMGLLGHKRSHIYFLAKELVTDPDGPVIWERRDLGSGRRVFYVRPEKLTLVQKWGKALNEYAALLGMKEVGPK